jgi:hypothetical protein
MEASSSKEASSECRKSSPSTRQRLARQVAPLREASSTKSEGRVVRRVLRRR